MVKIENAIQAKDVALDFLAKMGLPIWSNEVQSIKKTNNNWTVQVKDTRVYGKEEIIKLEIEAETGNLISYEKIK
jgi:hypothetical protein